MVKAQEIRPTVGSFLSARRRPVEPLFVTETIRSQAPVGNQRGRFNDYNRVVLSFRFLLGMFVLRYSLVPPERVLHSY